MSFLYDDNKWHVSLYKHEGEVHATISVYKDGGYRETTLAVGLIFDNYESADSACKHIIDMASFEEEQSKV